MGEHVHGLYALPSLVDQNTVTIAPAQTGLLLLEGPASSQTQQTTPGTLPDSTGLPLPGHNVRLPHSSFHVNIPLTFQSLPKDKRDNMAPLIILGKYLLITLRKFLTKMLKWRTDSDTNLTIVCRHRWSRQMTMKVNKCLKLSARTSVFTS